MVTVDYRRLQQVTEWLQWVTGGYLVVTAGYSRLPSSHSGLQQDTEWLQWVTTGYRRLPSGYSGLQQVTAG